MSKKFLPFFVISVFFAGGLMFGQSAKTETRMITQPAISKDKIAFIYANDLWTADLNGANPKRLTVDEGIESDPHFSPDGKFIAFSAEYEGNTDVYLVPSEGGVPKRLTYHPGPDMVRGFTPDGKSVLFVSFRNDFSGRLAKPFLVPLDGGFPIEIPLQSSNWVSYSPDGSMLAYNPNRDAFREWKHYRGGTVSEIWIYKFNDKSIEKVPQPKDFCNDAEPVWLGDLIYFMSDRNGEFNLFTYDAKSKEIKQLTNYNDFPVQNLSEGNGKIIFEQAGFLYVYNPETAKAEKLNIDISTDLLSVRPRFVKGANYIRRGSISPSGARAVFEDRGEIITVPADKGDARNLTNSVNADDISPVWSPDGKSIAYFSDKTGEYKLYITSQDGKGEPKEFTLNGAGHYDNPEWSPDNKKISFTDNSSSLYYLDIETGKTKKIVQDIVYDVFNSLHGKWSPDSKWIVYTKLLKTFIQQVCLYSLDEDKSYDVTDGMSDVTEPVFDKSGKYLYFFGSTDAGPVKEWFDQSNIDMKVTKALYLTVLSKDSLSPLAKESDEEKISEKKDSNDVKDKKGKKDKDDKSAKAKEPPKTIIDIDNIQNRIVTIPGVEGEYSNLQTGKEGEIYYLEENPTGEEGHFGSKLHCYNLKERKDEVLSGNVSDYDISFDRSKILYTASGSWYISALGPKLDPSKWRLKTDAIEIYIDPMAEWKEIYDDAWRINRDYFYDPNMHGCDWKAMKEKYSAFLPYLTCRGDLNRVIMWLCSELGVGHSYSGGGDYFIHRDYVPVGLLGADYILENGRYRFGKIYGGINWTPWLRSPLTEPGVGVKQGDYLIAVNGDNLTSDEEIYKKFQFTAGKIVELTVSSSPDGKNPHTYNVVPISNEMALRHFNWLEDNRKKVDEATHGQAAYVYLPDTYSGGHYFFKRYFFPQTEKKAIIVDERFNGGGLIADYVIDILRRTYTASNTTRYGEWTKQPGASILGPKVMLINENAGSGGDMMPWMFRKYKLGTLVGKRTWGGLVGILGFPPLMDGGFVTAPNAGLWAEPGWICENTGVAPDIEVEQLPAEVEAGKDPQLDRAIEVINEQLKTNPPVLPEQPPFPEKMKKK